MWTYHPDLLAKPVPRYTSYPTAADFGPMAADTYRSALQNAEGDVSLYLHIPFCEKICFYCGCNTGRANRRHRLESYVSALLLEIATVGALLPGDTRVRRISFGGGSPNAIATDEFRTLVEAIHQRFNLADPEWSIELDPRSMTGEWADVLAETGVQRASLGVQTFSAACQQAIGRVQPEELIVGAVERLRAAGVQSLNFDLMYGLPGQSQDDLRGSLDRTCALAADRIALFGYAHVPHIVPRQRAIDASSLPDARARFDMAQLGHSYLGSHGFTPVGFDHFARTGSDPLAKAVREGRLHRNFQGFTADPSPNLIGLGSSAISSFPSLIAQNEKNSGRYRMKSSQGLLASERGIMRSADDRYRGAVITRLLCDGRARIGACLMREAWPRLQPFIARELATYEDGWLSVTPEGLPYARSIAALFDSYRQESARQFSSAI